MRALVAASPGSCAVESVDVAAPHQNEVLVEILASALCGSDSHVLAGRSRVASYPLVLGHEGLARVVEVGSGVANVRPGQVVLLATYGVCGECLRCLAGEPAGCIGQARRNARAGLMPDGTSRLSNTRGDLRAYLGLGCLAGHAVVAAAQVVPAPATLSLDSCILGCGVITGWGAVLNVARVERGSSVAVVGCGAVGGGAVQGARLQGAAVVIAIDINREAGEAMLELGATNFVHYTYGSELAASIRRIVPDGVDTAIEAVGSVAAVSAAFAATRPGGTTVVAGGPPPNSLIELPADLLFQRRRLVGCVGGDIIPQRDLSRAIQLVESGLLRLGPLVGRHVSLDDAPFYLHANSLRGRTVVLPG